MFDAAPLAGAPLAARMRPRTLEEFVGQAHLVGTDGALTRVARPGYLPSMVLWGPPGSGKTTLARLVADRFGGQWRPISAVTSGVADIRQLVADARAVRNGGGRTVVFVDELHRFRVGVPSWCRRPWGAAPSRRTAGGDSPGKRLGGDDRRAFRLLAGGTMPDVADPACP